MKYIKPATIISYFLTIPAANWMVQNIGTQSFPNGPHTMPVGFGYSAPSGVLLIGIALVLRDAAQNYYGKLPALGCVAGGIVASYALAPSLAFASAAAFAVSELLDFGVFTKLRSFSLPIAVAVSGLVGSIADSFIFLQVAFGSTQFWQGQVIGKLAMSCIAALAIIGWRKTRHP